MMSHILKSVTVRQELKSLGMRGHRDLIWTASSSTFTETVSSLEHFTQYGFSYTLFRIVLHVDKY